MKLLFFFDLLVFALHLGAFVEDTVGGFVAHKAIAVTCIVGQGATLAEEVTTSCHHRAAKHLLANSTH